MTDVHAQPLDLAPKWFPVAWNLAVTSGDKTLSLPSAQPGYRSKAAPPGGLDLELVNAGLGQSPSM